MNLIQNYDKATLQSFLETLQLHRNTQLNCSIGTSTADAEVINGRFGSKVRIGRTTGSFKSINTQIPSIPFAIRSDVMDILSTSIRRVNDCNGRYGLAIGLQGFLVKGVQSMTAQSLAGFFSGGISTNATISELVAASKVPNLVNYEIDNIDYSKTIDEYFDRFNFTISSISDASGLDSAAIFPQILVGGGVKLYHPIFTDGIFIGLSVADDSITLAPANANTTGRLFSGRRDTDASSIYTEETLTKIMTSEIFIDDQSEQMLKALIGTDDVGAALQTLNDRVAALEQAIPIVSSTGNYIAI